MLPVLRSLVDAFRCTGVILLVYGEENSLVQYCTFLYNIFSEAAGLKPSSLGGITWPLCLSLPPKHVTAEENIPFTISSQLRVKTARL